MTDGDHRRKSWQRNLIVTAAVMTTVFVSLALAQLDALQARQSSSPIGLPIVNIQATAIAVGKVIPLVMNNEEEAPPVVVQTVVPVPDDLNPRPAFITGVSDAGVIFTVCGEVPEGWLLYTVRPGETLAALADSLGITEGELAAANCLNAEELTAGLQILVPREPPASLCGPPQFWVRYQVQPGETMALLARQRNTTVEEILRANCRDTIDLQAGQSIFLPPAVTQGTTQTAPLPSLTPLPTPTVATIVPTFTAQPTSFPTGFPTAPRPTQPPAPTPTNPAGSPLPPTATPPLPPTTTPRPTNTVPPPTVTPRPTNTVPPPTSTLPPPTNTVPPPTSTPPPPTNTPLPPTNTPQPLPTNTPEPPPTDTPEPPPTDTPQPPPTNTPEPLPTESPPPDTP